MRSQYGWKAAKRKGLVEESITRFNPELEKLGAQSKTALHFNEQSSVVEK